MAKVQQAAAVEHELVVTESFLDYSKGEVITDEKKVADLLESEWQHHFIKKSKAPAEPSAD